MRQKKSAQLRVWGELGTWAKKVEGLFCMLSVYLQLGRKRIRPNYEWRMNLQLKQKVETRKKDQLRVEVGLVTMTKKSHD